MTCMIDTYENYIGKVIKNERLRLGITVPNVCNGICSISVYTKLETGEYAGGMHVLKALCQRLGINADRCGIYLAQAEYDELMDRIYILEDIRDGRIDNAKEGIRKYQSKYKDIPLNNQFILFIEGRFAELEGDIVRALELYDKALCVTMPGYKALERIPCITIYEAYMMLGAARLSSKLEDEESAYDLYMLLLKYCESSNVESWNLVCIYPKAVCGMMDLLRDGGMSIREAKVMFRHSIAALDILRKTERLHYIRPLLQNIIELNGRVKNPDCNNEYYYELIECFDGIFKKYGHERDLFEWYPYYVDCGFRCVNELIDERRQMYGMSIESLAGDEQSARNVQRIIRGQTSPGYKTSKELLDKLGLKGVLRSDVIVADNIEAYKLWDRLVECIGKYDLERAKSILERLTLMLDKSVELNCMALKYINVKLDLNNNKINSIDAAERLAKILPFGVSEVKKHKHFIRIEKMILFDYLYLQKNMNLDEWNELFDSIVSEYSDNEFIKKSFASVYESICILGANYLGDRDMFDKSDEISLDAIKLEIACERMHVLPSLMYSIAWNKEVQNKVTDAEIELCRYACTLASYNNDLKRIELYTKWMEKNSDI